MQLEIVGLNAVKSQFSSIWGRYVSGFNSKQHCQACHKKSHPDVIDFGNDRPITLLDDVEYSYLCALGKPRSAASNVQLVVKPHPGAVASAGSICGVTFTIRDALAVRIKSLPLGWQGKEKSYTQCPNFQFGVQVYGYPTNEGSLIHD